jgi:hypothetical protein
VLCDESILAADDLSFKVCRQCRVVLGEPCSLGQSEYYISW